ncbi:aspartate--tRNA ligase [Candidatus Shapirobacteria bacterium]|nr:aspartate--tRNA ligase [Candidatus Shapirobacteria bacterium]
MERILTTQTVKKIGQKVKLCGWVSNRRDHGQLVFIDLRDRSGIVQLVGDRQLGELRSESVIEVIGEVKKRPAQMINKKIPTGEVEVAAEKMIILAKAKELPFSLETSGYEVNEELRLKYRYLDLRRERMLKNLELRHQMVKFIRDYLDERGFIEVETPILSKATPEGARDFLVPSRLQPGKFYALPQSPQQYKQLLMVAGLEKYYQIARCFRDEDPRADRAYGEFTQLDLEMSFVDQEEIFVLIENLYKGITEKILGKKVYQFPFPRLSWEKVMKEYGTDKPDLRPDKKDKNCLAFCFIKDFPLFEWKEKEKRWDSMHHPFTRPKEEDLPLLDKDPGKVHSYQHDLVLNGYEVGGGSLRISDPKVQEKVFAILGHSQKAIHQKFGHLLEAFQYGVPPHGGIAPGIDRFLKVVLDEPSLREVMAFPMTSGGQTSVMEAPSEVEEEQLKELKIILKPSRDKNASPKKR